MDNERDTREVKSVDAFSQLPFIRSAPAAKEKTSSGVRLFGIEFPNKTEGQEDSFDSSCSKQDNEDDGDCGGDNNRKFECYYCCRIFPTSQALGGHQNAHKRERLQAKRTHFQSGAVATVAGHYHHHGGLHALLNSLPTRLGFGHYPSWTLAPYPTLRLYGDPPHPISGSPVSGPWRSPHVGRRGWANAAGSVKLPERHSDSAAPLFLGDGSRILGVVGRVHVHGSTATSSSTSSSSPPSSQRSLVCGWKPAGVEEQQISLDLNL